MAVLISPIIGALLSMNPGVWFILRGNSLTTTGVTEISFKEKIESSLESNRMTDFVRDTHSTSVQVPLMILNILLVAIPANRKEADRVLGESFPKEKENILRYFETVYQFHNQTNAFMVMQAKSTGEPSEFKKLLVKSVFAKKFPVLAKYAMCSTQVVLDEFFEDRELQLCLSAYWCFMGMPPERFPFSILARCTAIYIEDQPYYLRGGSQVISQALADKVREKGGMVSYNCGAKEILVKNKKAYGVIDDKGVEYTCDDIISGISPIDTYFKLIKKEEVPKSAKEYLAAYTVGISALTCFIGLDCTPEEIGYTDSFNLTYANLDCNEGF